MFDFTLSTPISIAMAMSALTGVTIHDTKIDKLTLTAVGAFSSIAAADAVVKFNTDAHTHVEHIKVEKNSHPRIKPRDDHKKHLMQKNVPKGGHSFDGYALPVA